MFQLSSHEFGVVRPLFRNLVEHLIIQAVIDCSTPGRIYVDNKETPTAAFLCSVEGYFLVGDSNNKNFATNLSNLIHSPEFQQDTVRKGEEGIDLAIDPETWGSHFEILFKKKEPFTTTRKHYTCNEVKYNWRGNLEEGYTLSPIDRELLDNSQIKKPNHILEWIITNWGSVDNFLENGFGFCLFHDNEIVSWCIADCTSGNSCEVGIHTRPEYRRKGLATITASAATSYALSKNWKQVGWHCDEENRGSWGVAEKAGYNFDHHYLFYSIYFDEARHLAYKGWKKFQNGYFQEATDIYEKALRISDLPANFYHAIARAYAELGENKKSIKYIHLALDKGFRDVSFTRKCDSFRQLHDTPEWNTLLKRLKDIELID
jgi:RimJ/RimL family protein N-acetyltransferase